MPLWLEMATAPQNAWATTKGDPRVLFMFDADVAADSDIGWMQCGVEGEWEGHPGGKFKLDAKLFDALIARFEANGRPVACDWRHLSESGIATKEAGEASGWIVKLERRVDDEGRATMWARVDWTAEAASAIRSKKYRFCSPSIGWAVPDAKTNKKAPELTSVALTNKPFLAGMQPLQLSRGDTVDEPKPTEDKPAADAPQTMSVLDKFAEAKGKTLAEIEAWLADNFDKVAALMDEQQPAAVNASNDVLMLAAQVTALSKDIVAIKNAEAKRSADSVVAEVDGYIKEGRVLMGMRDLAIRTFSSDRVLAAKTWPAGTKAAPVNEMQGDKPASGNAAPGNVSVDVLSLSSELREFRGEMVSQRMYFDRLKFGGHSDSDAYAIACKRISA